LFYNKYLDNLKISDASSNHYINHIKYIVDNLLGKGVLSKKNEKKYVDIINKTEADILNDQSGNYFAIRSYYKDNINFSGSTNSKYPIAMMNPETLDLSPEELDE
jgi:hypothetical protein